MGDAFRVPRGQNESLCVTVTPIRGTVTPMRQMAKWVIVRAAGVGLRAIFASSQNVTPMPAP